MNGLILKLPRFALEAVVFGGIIIFVLILLLTQEGTRQVIPLATVKNCDIIYISD